MLPYASLTAAATFFSILGIFLADDAGLRADALRVFGELKAVPAAALAQPDATRRG